MVVDAHLHCSGREQADDVLRALDEARVDVAVLLAPFLTPPYTLHDAAALAEANAYLARLVADHRDRLVGLAVVNPALPGAVDAVRDAHARGLTGLKMVPSGWYPYDDCAHRVYAEAAARRMPVLFHSGIFIDGRSGRYCRPVYFEAVREHPDLKVTLAHLGWPWTDEANAVGVIDRINGVDPDVGQFRFDLSFGPPPIYRRDALARALDVLTPALLQFGSDRFLPCSGAHIADAIREVEALFDQLAVSPPDRERIMGGTARAWLNLPAR